MIKNIQIPLVKIDSTITKMQQTQGNDIIIQGYASTTNTDRAGDIIQPSAWQKGGLTDYLKNPILLYNHNYDKPIGTVTQLSVDSMGLKVKASVAAQAQCAVMVKKGIIKTFSVGFQVKQADYIRQTGGIHIKSAYLVQISAVTVPCNSDALFEVSKSFQTQKQYNKFIQNIDKGEQPKRVQETQKENNKMDPQEIEGIVAKALAAADQARALRQRQEKQQAKKAAQQQQVVNKAVQRATVEVLKSSQQKLMAQVTKRMQQAAQSGKLQLADLKQQLKQKGQQLQKMTKSKRVFQGGSASNSWKKQFKQDIQKAYVLGRVTNKGYQTQFGKDLLQKVNAFSSVQVSSQDFQQQVSTDIQIDIENELILAPMFNQIAMTSASMILPIQPDAGYAEMTSNRKPSGTPPSGSLDQRGVAHGTFDGIKLRQVELKTYKMIAKTYLANQTQQDAILPILPILRDSMIRQHARGVQNLLLLGNHSDGVYSSVSNGLLQYAQTANRNIVAPGTDTPLTAATLFTLRKAMGKYGMRQNDLVYIVSQRGYYQLIQDAQFQDANIVGANNATKLTGQVGQLYGSSVVMCDQFPQAAAGKYNALVLNRRNFLVPRLRGFMSQSEYLVEQQHRVMVTSQRLGFQEVIANAPAVIGHKYAAA